MHFAALPRPVVVGASLAGAVPVWLGAQASGPGSVSGPYPGTTAAAGYSRQRQWLKAFCLIGAVGFLALALMQPQWGVHWENVPSQGRHVMLLLDVSRSMLAEDVKPNRLERAKAAIRELVQVMQKEGGHRLGLVVFASRAALHCPLTLDYAILLSDSLRSITTLLLLVARRLARPFGRRSRAWPRWSTSTKTSSC